MGNYGKIKGFAFIILGVIAFILSGFSTPKGNTVMHKSYGGDAYTGIQNAAASSASNTYYLESTMCSIYSKTMMFTGLVFLTNGGLVLYKEIEDFKRGY